jgi:hypothetical protein
MQQHQDKERGIAYSIGKPGPISAVLTGHMLWCAGADLDSQGQRTLTPRVK